MMLQFAHVLVLIAMPLLLLPWLRSSSISSGHSWLDLLPPDPLSTTVGALLKLLASCAIGSCVLGLAGPFIQAPSEERVGYGAQIVLLLDRSRSMDEPFADRVEPGASRESKGSAARRQLAEFARHRSHDLISMVAFTSIPIHIIGFTSHPDVVQAAIRAGNEGRGLGETDVGRGILAAAAEFVGQPYNGSRVILLVSDGGARLDEEMRQRIAEAMKRERISLYWLYLRTRRSPGLLAERDVDVAAQDQVPEHFLNQFFAGMGTPYHAYEAEDPGALRQAVADVDRLERLPMHYSVSAAPRDFTRAAYTLALVNAALLLLSGLAENRAWK